MQVVLQDGNTFDVGDFKAVRGGVVLFENEERESVLGFLPFREIKHVLSDKLAQEQRQGAMGQPRQMMGQQQQPGQTVGQQQPGQTVGQQQPQQYPESQQPQYQQTGIQESQPQGIQESQQTGMQESQQQRQQYPTQY
jgi:hypothetical protein